MFMYAQIEKITKWTHKNQKLRNLAQTQKMYFDWCQKIYLSREI